jgi:hypothetical protein
MRSTAFCRLLLLKSGNDGSIKSHERIKTHFCSLVFSHQLDMVIIRKLGHL